MIYVRLANAFSWTAIRIKQVIDKHMDINRIYRFVADVTTAAAVYVTEVQFDFNRCVHTCLFLGRCCLYLSLTVFVTTLNTLRL